MKIRTCIFDFDGTLVESLQDVVESLLYAFSVNRITVPELNQETIMQHSLADTIEVVAPEITVEQRDAVIKAFTIHYDKSGYPNTLPMPGVAETLEELKRRAISCFIVSNKRQKPIFRILKNLKWEGYFSDIFSPDMVSGCSERKSKGKLIAGLIEKHALIKAETAYIGDMELDVIAARENGLFAVAVESGYGNSENYVVKPDKVIIKMPEVLALAQ